MQSAVVPGGRRRFAPEARHCTRSIPSPTPTAAKRASWRELHYSSILAELQGNYGLRMVTKHQRREPRYQPFYFGHVSACHEWDEGGRVLPQHSSCDPGSSTTSESIDLQANLNSIMSTGFSRGPRMQNNDDSQSVSCIGPSISQKVAPD